MLQQPLLFIAAGGVVADATACGKHAMTQDDDGEWIVTNGSTDGAHGVRLADLLRKVSVRYGAAEGDGEERIPHALLKIGVSHNEGNGKAVKISEKISTELLQCALQNIRHLLMFFAGCRSKGNGIDTAIGPRDAQCAEIGRQECCGDLCEHEVVVVVYFGIFPMEIADDAR